MTLSHPQTYFISLVVGQFSICLATQTSLEQLVSRAIKQGKMNAFFIDVNLNETHNCEFFSWAILDSNQ